MNSVPMGWIECVLCDKFRCDFMAQTCALIAPVQPILHRVSFSNETLTNAPKHYKNAPKPYLGEEDELESRTTQMQEGEDDEDIPPNDTLMPTTQQGPMTRARARELNYQVNSFLAVHKR